MGKIFIVEDDENIKDLIIYALNNEGYKTEGFIDSDSFYREIQNEMPILVILDIMIPGDDGFQVLEKLRNNKETKNLPIIILTAKTSEFHRVKGLDMGADDYISKPFSVIEMVSRVNALLRRYKISKEEELSKGEDLIIDGLKLIPSKRLIYIGEKEIDLTFKEFELLQYLMENKNIVLTRSMIMNEVWGFDFEGESRTIDVHIRSLRRKLGDKGNLIKTVHNVGYKIGN